MAAPLLERIFTPRRLLVFFALMNILTYYDRGAIASTLNDISKDQSMTEGEVSELSSSKLGALGSAFMVGFMVFCPLFAAIAHKILPTRLVGLGLFGWALATFFCSVSPNYVCILLARTLVGVGEASFVGLAPTVLDNVAPPHQRTLWLGIYFAAIPVGQALGIGIGGAIADHVSLPHVPGWRAVFFTESVMMVPFALLCFAIPKRYNRPPDRNPQQHQQGTQASDLVSGDDSLNDSSPLIKGGGGGGGGAPPERFYTLPQAVSALAHNPTYMLVSFGYAAYTFCLGAIAFWAPDFIENQLHLNGTVGSSIFGALTVVCGLIGTGVGGVALDRMGGSGGSEGLAKALRFMTCAIAVAFPVGIFVFLFSTAWLFFVLIAVTEFFMFLTQAPVNAVLLSAVATELRSYAMSVNVFIIHLLGDFPSPYCVGFLTDHVTHDLRWSMLTVYLVMGLCGTCWGLAWLGARRIAARRGNPLMGAASVN